MKLYNENDKSVAKCGKCKCQVETTYKFRDVPSIDDKVITKNIIVGLCDNCGSIVDMPKQSIPAVMASYAAHKASLVLKPTDALCGSNVIPEISTDTNISFQITSIQDVDLGGDKVRVIANDASLRNKRITTALLSSSTRNQLAQCAVRGVTSEVGTSIFSEPVKHSFGTGVEVALTDVPNVTEDSLLKS